MRRDEVRLAAGWTLWTACPQRRSRSRWHVCKGELLERERVGAGVFECRIDFGPGYRVYFGKDGDTVVILVAGGTKQRQECDITAAHERWKDYKRRKVQDR